MISDTEYRYVLIYSKRENVFCIQQTKKYLIKNLDHKTIFKL